MLEGIKSGRVERSQAALRGTPFGRLKLQVWRLQGFLTVLVGVIGLVPPSVFFMLELAHLREHARQHAAHFAHMITSQVEKSGLDLQALSSLLQQEMAPNGIVSFRLMGQGGKEILQVSQPDRPFLGIEAAFSLLPTVAPLQELYVTADDRPLLYRAARVVGIHLTVATLLAFAIYQMGVRSLHRAVEELEAMQAQLIHSEKLSAIGEIYAGLTHEINNPLGIILSKAEIMLYTAKEKKLSAELVRDLEMIHRHGARIAEIIRGLLAFARRTSFDLTRIDLNRVIDETVSLFEKSLSSHQIQIERQLDRDLPHIVASPIHLQQVFLNLLNNARDAMPQGGTITLRTYRNRRHLVAEVQDTGIGIADDISRRIFDPFFTTKDVGKGTGLGLSVSYGIVRGHGGDIEVESSLGKGALFRLTLPIEGEE
jgi:signal transduction histidine kinase